MRDGFVIFDTHTHIGEARHSGRVTTADELLRSMDRHGVDRSLAIPFPVVDDHRATHDLIAEAVRRHPSRLAGAACLDPFLGEQAVPRRSPPLPGAARLPRTQSPASIYGR